MIKTSLLRRGFVDICKGYSPTIVNGKPAYIRHLSHYEHLDFEDLQEKIERELIEKGSKTEAQRLTVLKNNNLWGDEEELDISRQRENIGRLQDSLKTIFYPSAIKVQENYISEEKKKLALAARKARLEAQKRTRDSIRNNK